MLIRKGGVVVRGGVAHFIARVAALSGNRLRAITRPAFFGVGCRGIGGAVGVFVVDVASVDGLAFFGVFYFLNLGWMRTCGGGWGAAADLRSDSRFVALDVFVAFSSCFWHLVSLLQKVYEERRRCSLLQKVYAGRWRSRLTPFSSRRRLKMVCKTSSWCSPECKESAFCAAAKAHLI
jgi:hypothetical protein